MKIEIATREHLVEIEKMIPADQRFADSLDDESARRMAEESPALAFRADDGTLMAVFGAYSRWPRRWELWGLSTPRAMHGYGPELVAAIRAAIESLGPGRIEATTITGDARYMAFARAVGMKRDGVRVKYFPDGRDAQAFVRIQ